MDRPALIAAGAPMLRNGGAAPSQGSEEGGVGFDRPDHAAVFDLSMGQRRRRPAGLGGVRRCVLLAPVAVWEAYAGVSW